MALSQGLVNLYLQTLALVSVLVSLPPLPPVPANVIHIVKGKTQDPGSWNVSVNGQNEIVNWTVIEWITDGTWEIMKGLKEIKKECLDGIWWTLVLRPRQVHYLRQGM